MCGAGSAPCDVSSTTTRLTRARVPEAAGRVGMLLCLSSRRWRVFEESVEVAGEVALEAAGGFAAALSFADSLLDVVDCRLVDSASGEDDLVGGPGGVWGA